MHIWRKFGIVTFWILLPALSLYLKISKRTRVLVSSGDKILVVKSWLGNGKWALPGGGLHRREGPLAGVRRELLEETGVSIAPEQFNLLSEMTYRQHGIKFRYVCFSVETPHAAPIKRQSWELADAAWIARNDLGPDTANPDVCYALAARFQR